MNNIIKIKQELYETSEVKNYVYIVNVLPD